MTTVPFTGGSQTIAQTKSFRKKKTARTWFDKIMRREAESTRDLEEVIDLDKDYNNFTTQTLQTVNPKQLYSLGIFSNKSTLYKKQREEKLKVGENDIAEIDVISKQAGKQLVKTGYEMCHIGLIVIGIKPLHRGGLAKRTLLTIADKGMGTPEDQLIASIETDMNQKAGIFYCSPDIIMRIIDIQKFFKIGIMTRGYGYIEHPNLAITVAVLGRLSNSTATGYKLNISSIIEAAATQGVEMIKAEPTDPTLYTNQMWDISKLLTKKEVALLPTKKSIFKQSDGSLSLRFHSYEKTENSRLSSDDEDEEA